MSPCRNWDSPNPSLASKCATPTRAWWGDTPAHSHVGEGLGESQFQRLEKKLSTLPTLYVGCNDFDAGKIHYEGHWKGVDPEIVDFFATWNGYERSKPKSWICLHQAPATQKRRISVLWLLLRLIYKIPWKLPFWTSSDKKTVTIFQKFLGNHYFYIK